MLSCGPFAGLSAARPVVFQDPTLINLLSLDDLDSGEQLERPFGVCMLWNKFYLHYYCKYDIGAVRCLESCLFAPAHGRQAGR